MWFNKKDKKINVLIVGNKGQLGSYIEKKFREDSLKQSSQFNLVFGCDLPEVDVSINFCIDRYLNPREFHSPVKINYVINCSAATDTEKIETSKEARDQSYEANVLGPANIAKACRFYGVKLIHISTDYVFSEKSLSYGKEFPRNMYGIHKLLGEKMIEAEFGRLSKNFMILRTSWLYGNSLKSFPIKFLKNCMNAKLDEDGKRRVKVVDDCIGRPTSVQWLTEFISSAIANGAYGKMDAQSTQTPISRFRFAEAILYFWKEHAAKNPLPDEMKMENVEIVPCKSSDFPSAVDHPKQIPSEDFLFTNEISVSTERTMCDKTLLEVIQSCPNGDFVEMLKTWLEKHNGYKMIEDSLLESR